VVFVEEGRVLFLLSIGRQGQQSFAVIIHVLMIDVISIVGDVFALLVFLRLELLVVSLF
jgi:hypothetical protein